MPIKDAYPVRIKPAGLSDAFDSTEAFQGACTSLQNLIFDTSNPECVISRPGVGTAVLTAAQVTTQIGTGTASYFSIHVGIGTRVYGLVSMTGGTYAGLDVPFCYDFSTSSFVTITGYTTLNLPTSPATSGTWIPPTVAAIGTYLIWTHPGFPGTGILFFGALNTSTNVWSAQNTGTNTLPSAPRAVGNLNNRAYFAIGNQSYYSDVLNPLVMTNAGQALTHGDATPVIGYSGLPVSTTSAGVIQAMIVLKPAQIWQISGDAATSANPLSQTYLSLNLGCSAARSICQTPNGTMFIGTDGPMLVDQLGLVRNIVNDSHKTSDVRLPFINTTAPSRIAAAFAVNIYRVCVPTVIYGNTFTGDYWFDKNRGRWNGPHTFTYDCASQVGSYFLLSGPSTGANLYASTPTPTTSSVYTDNGTPISVIMTTSDFPKTGHMNEVQVIESTNEFAASGLQVGYTVTMYDDEGNFLSSCVVTTATAGVTWDGGSLWDGGALWVATIFAPAQYFLPWNVPLVSDKFVLDIRATSSSGLMIGSHFSRYQDTGYVSFG